MFPDSTQRKAHTAFMIVANVWEYEKIKHICSRLSIECHSAPGEHALSEYYGIKKYLNDRVNKKVPNGIVPGMYRTIQFLVRIYPHSSDRFGIMKHLNNQALLYKLKD
jgi:hypothetical protein